MDALSKPRREGTPIYVLASKIILAHELCKLKQSRRSGLGYGCSLFVCSSCRWNSLDEVGRLERHERVELVVEESDSILLELITDGMASHLQYFFSGLLVAAMSPQPTRKQYNQRHKTTYR